jgi:hypothetical protein
MVYQAASRPFVSGFSRPSSTAARTAATRWAQVLLAWAVCKDKRRLRAGYKC